MAKQLTLFGKVVPSTKAGVYAQPSNNYEKFVERYFQRNRSLGRSRGDVLKAAPGEEEAISLWSGP